MHECGVIGASTIGISNDLTFRRAANSPKAFARRLSRKSAAARANKHYP
jgi:hypothetical protein